MSSPEWIVSRRSEETSAQPPGANEELIAAAKRLWPRIQTHARKKLPKWNPDDSVSFATEVWEGVLVSVAKTLQRQNRLTSGIADLEAYLFGVFLHRFNRALKRERHRQETIEVVASSRDLEQLEGARNVNAVADLERSLQVNQVIENMDAWTREVFAARLYGYSWREIAEHHGLNAATAKLRFRAALRKLAGRLRPGK